MKFGACDKWSVEQSSNHNHRQTVRSRREHPGGPCRVSSPVPAANHPPTAQRTRVDAQTTPLGIYNQSQGGMLEQWILLANHSAAHW